MSPCKNKRNPLMKTKTLFGSNTHKQAKGFTLIELMIVVAIIGIFAAIALPAFKAHDAQEAQLEVQATKAETLPSNTETKWGN